jgi:hypothetical protein
VLSGSTDHNAANPNFAPGSSLARLLGGRRLGIVLSDHTDENGALIFQHACKLGLEGIVSKRLSAPHRSGPSRDWIKVKNPDSPAMARRLRGVLVIFGHLGLEPNAADTGAIALNWKKAQCGRLR